MWWKPHECHFSPENEWNAVLLCQTVIRPGLFITDVVWSCYSRQQFRTSITWNFYQVTTYSCCGELFQRYRRQRECLRKQTDEREGARGPLEVAILLPRPANRPTWATNGVPHLVEERQETLSVVANPLDLLTLLLQNVATIVAAGESRIPQSSPSSLLRNLESSTSQAVNWSSFAM